MKFWKTLSSLIEETLPEWRDKFLSYKNLKKQLKLIYPEKDTNGRPRNMRYGSNGEACMHGGNCAVTEEVNNFERLLDKELEKFNGFFLEKEEDYVIRLKELQDQVAENMDSDEELMKVGREIADLHGEMVLLENYSAFNLIGLANILKKYEKRSGALIRPPFNQKVLEQPFFSTDLLNKLAKECEVMLDRLFSNQDPQRPAESAPDEKNFNAATGGTLRLVQIPAELAELEYMESMYMKLTRAALRSLKEIRTGSSFVPNTEQ